ncbi:MAG: pyrroline-5-carboxylate reductase [Candidatus Contendobacter odensis]|uniref:Pyrroline-5-carboxylate reductase n=1 Tax=Candidatus Contendibacter odensensis TaxID=1400860 RepID=A0A2G6PEV7_9GAMM|nr:MAG: pyrroline-5-carboxylate reductase [Candidatus Contendobacter odensis]
MKDTPIAFIGGGNMARSLIGGLLASSGTPECIQVAEPDASQSELLHSRFGIHTSTNNREIAAHAKVIVLAIKPQILRSVVEDLAEIVQQNQPLVISIAAGVREPDICRWLGGQVAVVRTMPNTPALVGSGVTALFANTHVSKVHQALAESLLRAVGAIVWVRDEALLDAVTAVSGSGPAYFFLIMEALEQAGIKLGLDKDTARLLTQQTAFGAAKMALESMESPASLRVRVTSPGGTTERALETLQNGGLDALITKAVEHARQRSHELGDLLGESP